MMTADDKLYALTQIPPLLLMARGYAKDGGMCDEYLNEIDHLIATANHNIAEAEAKGTAK